MSSKTRYKIHWHQWEKTPAGGSSLSHGVHFHDIKQAHQNDLVGFIEGFDWLHQSGQGVTVKGYHIKPNKITTTEVINAMKQRIEKLINMPDGSLPLDGSKINRRISAIGNC